MNGVRNEPFICPRGLCGTRLITKHRGPYSQHSIDCDLISVLAYVTTLSIRPMKLFHNRKHLAAMMRSCKLWLLATMAKTRGRNQYISCVGVLICITTRLDFTPQLQSQRSVSSGLKAFQPHHQKSTYFTSTTLQKTSRVNWVTCRKSSKFLFDLNQYNLLYFVLYQYLSNIYVLKYNLAIFS